MVSVAAAGCAARSSPDDAPTWGAFHGWVFAGPRDNGWFRRDHGGAWVATVNVPIRARPFDGIEAAIDRVSDLGPEHIGRVNRGDCVQIIGHTSVGFDRHWYEVLKDPACAAVERAMR